MIPEITEKYIKNVNKYDWSTAPLTQGILEVYFEQAIKETARVVLDKVASEFLPPSEKDLLSFISELKKEVE